MNTARARAARTPGRRRLPAAVVTALAIVALVVPGLAVTAAVTRSSTVAGNLFGATDRVDVGVHDLTVVPAGGRGGFRPGEAGTVSYRMTPVGRDTVPVDLRAGDALVFSTTLPSWLEPGTLPATSTFANGRIEWATTQDPGSGAWTVSRTSRFTGAQSGFTATNRLSFPVVARGVLTGGDVVASVSAPEHLASTAPSDAVAVTGTSHVEIGVHDLAVTPTDVPRFTEGTVGTVTFRATPSSAIRPTDFRADEALVHTFTLPGWLAPGTLPVYLPAARSHTVWSSSQDPDSGIWTVRRTQTFFEDWTSFNTVDLGFPVQTVGVPVAGDTIRAGVALPGGLTSSRGSDEIDALAAARLAVGVYDLQVAPASGSAFLPDMTGTLRFATTAGAATVPARFDDGDTLSHDITVPSWLEVLLPVDDGAARWVARSGAGGTTVVTRTETLTARTEHTGSVVELPVRARRTGLGQATASVTATVPAHSVSASRTGSVPVASTSATSVGMHALAVSPDAGDRFVPGAQGAVTFRLIPTSTAPFTAGVGDRTVHQVVLPAGLVPGALYAPSEGPSSTIRWDKSESGGVWTVTRTEEFHTELADHTFRNNATFTIRVTAGPQLADGALVSATATVPGHLTSTAPIDAVPVSAVRVVDVGAYDLTVTPSTGNAFLPGMRGTVRFDTTPGGAGVPVDLAPGDQVVHTVTLPSWLSPAPVPTGAGGVTWSAVPGPDGTTTLTRTQASATAQTQFRADRVEIPVRAARPGSTSTPGTVSVATGLPEHAHPARETATALVASTTRTAVGVYGLSAAPTTGERFGVGSTGRLRFRLLPESASTAPFTARQGDVLVHTIELPRGLNPGALPAQSVGDWSTTTWASTTSGGASTITRTERFDRDVADDTYRTAEAPTVTVAASGSLQDGAEVRATVTLPDHLTSDADTTEVPVGAVTVTDVGVHGLTVAPVAGTWFQPDAPGTLRFDVTPGAASTALRIDADDAVSHTITLPSWLAVDGNLPDEASTGYSTVRWTAEGSRTVIRTETFSGPRSTHPAVRVELPVRAARTVGTATGTVLVDVALPLHSASSADQRDVGVTASTETLVGIHGLTVTPTGTDAFAPGGEGTVSFLTTPTASTPVAFTAAPGTALVHTVTLPSWLEPGTLPTEAGAVWTRSTVGSNQVRVTRTATLGAAATTYTTPRLQFPVVVTATGVPSTGAPVSAGATVPSPLTTQTATASTTLQGTSVVHDGAYHVTARPNAGTAFRPGTWGTVSFKAAADTPTARALTYQPGEVRSHAITLPAELTAHLPLRGEVGPSSEVSWALTSNGDGTSTVVRTERFTKASRDMANATLSLSVRASHALTTVDRAVTVRTTLPRGLVSAQEVGSGTAKMTSSPVQVGAFNLAAGDCQGGDDAIRGAIRSGCWLTYNMTPNGETVDADLRAGDVITHTLSAMDGGVFTWFPTTVEAETDDYRITVSPGNAMIGPQVTVRRRIEIKRDLTTIRVPAARIHIALSNSETTMWPGTALFGVTGVSWPDSMGTAYHQYYGDSQVRMDY